MRISYKRFDKNDPFKKVVKIVFSQSKYSRRGIGSNYFTLECGHIRREKTSYPIPDRMRCHDCRAALQENKEAAEQNTTCAIQH